MQRDIVIETIKFARQNLISGNPGLTIDEIYNHLISFKLIDDVEYSKKKVETLIGQLFTNSGTYDGKLMLKVESYFSLLEYEELQEARQSSRQANCWAIIALIVSIITSAISIYYNKLQLQSPTEIKQSQIDTIINSNKIIHNDIINFKRDIIKIDTSKFLVKNKKSNKTR